MKIYAKKYNFLDYIFQNFHNFGNSCHTTYSIHTQHSSSCYATHLVDPPTTTTHYTSWMRSFVIWSLEWLFFFKTKGPMKKICKISFKNNVDSRWKFLKILSEFRIRQVWLILQPQQHKTLVGWGHFWCDL